MNAHTTAARGALASATALLSELTRRGVELRANGDRLAYDAPRGAIGDLLPDLARFKTQLLELLAAAPVHRWQQSAATDTATGATSAPNAPDVALVRAQLRTLDLAIGAPASIRAVVRASRDLDAKQTRDTQRQWRALGAAKRHAEATALLANGIDPATVKSNAPANPQARQPRRPARDLLAFWRGRGVSLTMETVERDGANWRALAVDLQHVAPEQRDAIFDELQPNAREFERALAIEEAGGVAAYVAQKSAAYWSRKMAEATT